MADRFLFNSDEFEALWGLPWLAQLIYMRCMRPNMDYASGVVGVRTSRTKRLNYQALREQVEVHAGQGKSAQDRVTDRTLRYAIEQLVSAGLLQPVIGGNGRAVPLVFRCILAESDFSVSEKYGRSLSRGTAEVCHEVRQEVRQQENSSEASSDNSLSDSELGSTAGSTASKPEEVRHTKPEKCGTPPDPVITHTQYRAHARGKHPIPDDFSITKNTAALLAASMVAHEYAESLLVEFVAANQSSGYQSMNWDAEFLKFCRRQQRYDESFMQRGNGHAKNSKFSQSNGQSRSHQAHERDKQWYAEAVAREQGAGVVHENEGEVRAHVVVPYRQR